MDVQPFEIRIPQSVLDDLNLRLARTRWPDEIKDSGWERGAQLAYVKELAKYWQHQFDWRAQEKSINAYNHFKVDVDGTLVHFIYERGKGTYPIPVVITHGWPGSFVEMLKIVPLLTDPVAHGGDVEDSFDVVVPSIPGYGFSDRPDQEGMNAFRIADLWHLLMTRLGHTKFGAQGGDWGASIATCLGLNYSTNVIGLHLNYIPGSYKPWMDSNSQLSKSEQAFLESQEAWVQAEGGYGHIQATKPQTLAYALNDSPAGLAAWIVEKFRDWSDCNGAVESRFTKDELLTNIMIYWATETIHSSTRLYYEARKRPLHLKEGQSIQVPCGIARFLKEAPFPPREWVERSYNVQRWTEFDRGGHFAAMEEPQLLVDDIRAFFRPFRGL